MSEIKPFRLDVQPRSRDGAPAPVKSNNFLLTSGGGSTLKVSEDEGPKGEAVDSAASAEANNQDAGLSDAGADGECGSEGQPGVLVREGRRAGGRGLTPCNRYHVNPLP